MKKRSRKGSGNRGRSKSPRAARKRSGSRSKRR
jgi:hypothetical protein